MKAFSKYTVNKGFFLFIHGLFLLGSACLSHADRVTLFSGDIFIGTVLRVENHIYFFERFGLLSRYPEWTIKKIEPNVTQLEMPQSATKTPFISQITVNGQIVSVTSTPPVETSRLEIYPPRSHFRYEKNRYLRGYWVNRTPDAFQTVHVQLTYYELSGHILMQQETEFFDFFSMTMKPFIVDTRFVPWPRVKSILIEMISFAPK